MEEFTKTMPFLLFFLVGALFFHMLFGKKMTENFLLLVLLGMALKNADKIKTLLGKVNVK